MTRGSCHCFRLTLHLCSFPTDSHYKKTQLSPRTPAGSSWAGLEGSAVPGSPQSAAGFSVSLAAKDFSKMDRELLGTPGRGQSSTLFSLPAATAALGQAVTEATPLVNCH